MNIEIVIAPELKNMIVPLLPEEYAQLEENILAEGCRDPLVLWYDVLIDGHNRYEICQRHGLKYATVQKDDLVSLDDAKLWLAKNQLGRRNINDFVRAELALIIKPALVLQAKQRQEATQAKPGQQVSQVVQNSAPPRAKTRDDLAKVAGVSHDTISKVEKIIEKAAPEVIEQVRSGAISIAAAAKTIAPPKSIAHIPTADIQQQPKPAPVPAISIDEVAALREQLAEVSEALRHTLSDNEMMGRVFDADDRVAASMKEAERQKAIADNAERTLAAKNGEYIERARAVTHWKNRAEKAEKELAKINKVAA